MAEITLRAYLRQLEDLLGRDALDEVIAHCRHILERFPKNLMTYRLLGKAMLEKKRLQDASDIFQRVLSAEPDDFVSHLGMSLVYQEEGSIDQAIWHMERAFEQSSNNPTLQEELRNLFRQRDGGEPAKLQLTRGALARLYAKGELYDQAIAELTLAMQESPDRLDLQTLLAETLWNSRQPVKSGQVAAQVLHRLPNCLQANRILAELWLEAGQSSEARPFLQRVEALDPYMALELKSGGQPVPDDAVKLEQLEWTTEAAAAALDAPDWVRDLSIAFDQAGGQPVRATLPEISPAPAEEQEQAEAVTPSQPDTLGLGGPDWLGQSTEEPGPPVEEAPEPEPTPPSPAQPVPAAGAGETPEWLSEIISGQPSPPASTEQPAEEKEEVPNWLADVIGEESPPPQPEQPTPASETVSDEWLDSLLASQAAPETPTTPEQPASKAAPSEELPDWLRGAQELAQPVEEPRAERPEIEQAGAKPADALPDWLLGAVEPAEPESADLPASMPKEEVQVAPPTDEPTGEEKPEEEMPDWMASGDLDSDDALAWLEGLAARQGADPEEFVSDRMKTEGEQSTAEPEPLSEAEPAPVPAAEEEPEPVAAGELADDTLSWLESLSDESAVPTELVAERLGEGAPEAEVDTGGDIDWLREPIEAAPPAEAPTEEEPEWLKAAAEEEAVAEAKPEEPVIPTPELEPVAEEAIAEAEPEAVTLEPEPTAEEPVEPVEAPAMAEEMAWLDELAAEQGAEQDKFIAEALKPEEPTPAAAPPVTEEPAQLPDWLAEIAEKAPEAEVEELPKAEVEELPEAEVEEEELAWLAVELEGQKPAEEAGELAEWLREEAKEEAPEPPEPTPVPVTEEPSVPVAEEPGVEEELPDWLKGFGVPEEEEPEWLRPEAEVEVPSALAEPPVVEAEEMPDWLKPEAPEVEEITPPPAPAAEPEAEIARGLLELPGRPAELAEVSEELVGEPPAPEAVERPELAAPLEETALPEWLREAQAAADESVEAFLQEVQPPAPPVEPVAPTPPPTLAPPEPITPAPPPEPEPITPAPPLEPEPVVPPAEAGVAEPLALARQQMALGNTEQALDAYESLVSGKQYLDEVVNDLFEVVGGKEAVVPRTYRLLGDTLMAQDRLQEALDAYRHALDQF